MIQTTGGDHLGLWGMLAGIVRNEGWLSLYQGVGRLYVIWLKMDLGVDHELQDGALQLPDDGTELILAAFRCLF